VAARIDYCEAYFAEQNVHVYKERHLWTCSNCIIKKMKIIFKIMYRRRNFPQNWYGKGQFLTLLKA